MAVGDRVRFILLDDDNGIIEEILPRETRFARASFRGAEQTLVTNLDQLAIVFACAEPNPDIWRLDRWVISAEYHGLEPLIVANKCELASDEAFREGFGELADLGYRVLRVSAARGIGVDELKAALRGRITAFTGPSGVGKSSLLNAVQPGLRLATAEVGKITFKGRHTTTARQLIPLETGGWVADTPGLRQLELLQMEREELLACFTEFTAFIEAPCRFRDCQHESEPGCNLREAVAIGKVSQRRFESFLALAKEIQPARR